MKILIVDDDPEARRQLRTLLGANGYAVIEAGNGHRAAELVFTVEEEVGLRGARALDYSRLRSKQGVAFDLNGEPGERRICHRLRDDHRRRARSRLSASAFRQSL